MKENVKPTISDSAKRILDRIKWPVLATILGFVVGGIVILATGYNPFSVYATVFTKSFINSYYLGQTLLRSAPIIVCALAASVSWRAGYINLGVEGQMVCGALAATVCALMIDGPAILVSFISLIAACAAGAVYALIPTWAQHRYGITMVISSLILNYIANNLSSYVVGYPLKDPNGTVESMQTAAISSDLRLPIIVQSNNLNAGILIAIAAVAAVYILTTRTTFGYESKMVGLNPSFARYGGIRQTKLMYSTMTLSGALGGIAGYIEVFGTKGRFISDMVSSAGYAWTGLMSSLVGGHNPIAAFIYSVFFGGLEVGGQALQRDYGLPLQIADIIQCSIMLFVSINVGIRISGKARSRKAVREGGTKE